VEEFYTPCEIDNKILSPAYDSDDEEEDVDSETKDRERHDTDNTGEPMDFYLSGEVTPDGAGDGLGTDNDGCFIDTWDEIFEPSSRPDEGETEEAFAEREAKGEGIKGMLEMYLNQLTLVETAVRDALPYPLTHTYLHSVPTATKNNFQTMLTWSTQVNVDMKAKKVPVTWKKGRSRVLMRGG
jgi:hypothetical protein